VSVRTAEDPLALLAVEDPEQVPDAVVITDVDGTITAVNRSFTELHGYEPTQVVGRRPSLLSSGLHPSSVAKQLWETITTGRTWAGELVDRAADGTLRTIRARITPVRGPEGLISHFVSIQREVTSTAADLAGQLRVDVQGLCTFADDPAARLLREDQDPVQLLGSGLLEGLHIDDATALREVVEQVTRTARIHRIDLEGVRGYVRCSVRPDPSSRQLTTGAVADIRCEPIDR
jgi:PAS domain S-box-containing protein